jgi:hypothetical protein
MQFVTGIKGNVIRTTVIVTGIMNTECNLSHEFREI